MWYAVILGGGSGTRMGMDRNKILLNVSGESMLVRSIRAFLPFVSGLIVVIRSSDMAEAAHLIQQIRTSCPIQIVAGGETRQDSVRSGLNALPDSCSKVMIHDAARCLVDAKTIANVMQSVDSVGTGVASIPVTDTIKTVDEDSWVTSTPDRKTLRAVQTPQGFTKQLLLDAHLKAMEDGFLGTDDASLVERMGVRVHLTEGSITNMKITHAEDLISAERIIDSQQAAPLRLRIGNGFDAHRLVENRDLILCGVKIPYELGLLGHSDADVATHALIDAILGAACAGDIGKLFPDNDPAYKDISSMLLLKKAMETIADRYSIVNADITIIAQRPRLSAYIEAMRNSLAAVLAIPLDQVSVKATTTEGMGYEGRGEGISAFATVLLQ